MYLNKILNPGDRFEIQGCVYEVSHVDRKNIRSASVAGGKMMKLSIERFLELEKLNELTVTRKNDKAKLSPSQLNEKEVKEMNRRLAYIRHVESTAEFSRSKVFALSEIQAHAIKTKDDKTPGFSTYARWVRRYVRSNKNPLSLVPHYKNSGNKTPRLDYSIEQIIDNRIHKDYLTDQRLSGQIVYENIIANIIDEFADDNELPSGIIFPSRQTIYNRINALDPFVTSRKRNGKYIADKKFHRFSLLRDMHIYTVKL